MKVHLLNPSRSAEVPHWKMSIEVLRRAISASPAYELTDAKAADLVIVCCDHVKNPMFPKELWTHPVIREHRNKCIAFSTADSVLPVLPGIYASIELTDSDDAWVRGGFYPHVAYDMVPNAFDDNVDFRWLYSFRGSFLTHPIRKQLAAFADERALIEDTSRHAIMSRSFDDFAVNETTQSLFLEFQEQYLQSLKFSKFVLCPRGAGPSSIRLFETMKAGRVPVIIADQLVFPKDVPWAEFSVLVPEADVANIPRLLRDQESRFAEKARLSRQAWENYFAAGSLAHTVCRWSNDLLAYKRGARLPKAFYRQLRRPFFWRRGPISEIHTLLAAWKNGL